MEAKSILFNTDMVRAILQNRKTVTRRVVKPQPPGNFPYCHLDGDDLWYWTTRDGDDDMMDWWPSYEHGVKPPYQSGDILYVRETWQEKRGGGYLYKADTVNSFDLFVTPDGHVVSEIPWRPSIHMPKEAARIFLRVTGVRVERLQDITSDGVGAEGTKGRFGATLGAFEMLWDSTIKPDDLPLYGWTANPWVWVIEFERISKEGALQNE